jgi:hypothetical protein
MKVRNLLSIAFMMVFGFAMMVVGAWSSNAYVSGEFMIFFGLFASFVAATIVWAIWNLDISLRTAKPKAVAVAELNSLEKRKRDRLDSVLRDLSDADLLRLRQRLLDGTVNDDSLEEHLVGEDGELLYQEKRR